MFFDETKSGSVIVNEINKDTTEKNAKLIFDPATEIIDLEKYIDI